MPIFIETEEDNTTPTPRNFLDSPINPGDRFVGQTHGPAGMGMRAYMDRPETQPDWTPYDRSMGYTSPAHHLGQTEGPAGMGMNAYVNRPGITHPNLNGYQAWNATHSEGPSLEDLRRYDNAGWEYNKAQVNLNEPSARAAEWEQFNKLRGKGYNPLEFLTRPMVTDEGLTDYNEFGDQQWDLMGEIDPEMEANIPNWYKWYDKLIKRFGEEKGSQLWHQYAANDRGIGSLDEYQMAELRPDQIEHMQASDPSKTNLTRRELFQQIKDMEDKGAAGWFGTDIGARDPQEPTTWDEFNEKYDWLEGGGSPYGSEPHTKSYWIT